MTENANNKPQDICSNPYEYSCEDCDFFVPEENDHGQCFRHPPTPIPAEKNELGQIRIEFIRPTVARGEWCGEWQCEDDKAKAGFVITRGDML